MTTDKGSRWCWHRWSKWTDATATTTSVLYRGERESVIQFRRCEKCNRLKIRGLSS